MEQTHAYSQQLGEILRELVGVSEVLCRDIEGILGRYQDDWTDQTMRRTFLRACWSMIEGETYCLKRFTLRACELGGIFLSADEHVFLSENKVVVNEEGVAQCEFVHTAALSNIKRAFKIATDRFNLDWKPDFGGLGWRQLRASIRVRHRVTHPKSKAELAVSDDEFAQHKDAFAWYLATFNEFQLNMDRQYGEPQT